MTVTWTPRVSFAILRLVIRRKSWVNFSAVLNSDFISREHLAAPLILILPVGVNQNDCLHSFCCCFGAAGTTDLRDQAAQLHKVSACWRWKKEKRKSCHSSSFTMSSKPDTSALKQIPEGGCYGYKVIPAGSAVCQTFSNSPSGETKKSTWLKPVRGKLFMTSEPGRDLQERRDLLSNGSVSHSSSLADVHNLPLRA